MEFDHSHTTPLGVLLGAVRDSWFGRGIRCPRCSSEQIQRWGTFSERQRYRCLGCRRTFSDLTGSPMAYSKKPLLWPQYAHCMAEGLTVRASAARVGVHRCTAFRWRHATLDHLRHQDTDVVQGWIEVDWTWFPYSEKGRRPQVPVDSTLSTNVLLACDRHGRVVTGMTEVAPPRQIRSREVEHLLEGRVERPFTALAQQGRLGPFAVWAQRTGGDYVDARRSVGRLQGVPRALVHVRTVRSYRGRLHGWMERFHGVATRYLPNYLVWHRLVDHAHRNSVDRLLLRWLIGESRKQGPSTANRGPGGRDVEGDPTNSSREHDLCRSHARRKREPAVDRFARGSVTPLTR